MVPGAHGAPAYELTFTNRTAAPLDGFQLQFNKNAFLSPSGAAARRRSPRRKPALLGASRAHRPVLGPSATGTLQVAVKSPSQNGAVFYFSDQVPLEALLRSRTPRRMAATRSRSSGRRVRSRRAR